MFFKKWYDREAVSLPEDLLYLISQTLTLSREIFSSSGLRCTGMTFFYLLQVQIQVPTQHLQQPTPGNSFIDNNIGIDDLSASFRTIYKNMFETNPAGQYQFLLMMLKFHHSSAIWNLECRGYWKIHLLSILFFLLQLINVDLEYNEYIKNEYRSHLSPLHYHKWK